MVKVLKTMKTAESADMNHIKRNDTYSVNATARASMFSLSRLVVGSSSAKMPHCELKVSARANLKIKMLLSSLYTRTYL